MSEPRFITNDNDLRKLAEELRGCRLMGLDTEFLTERSYFPRLCLIQIATEDLLIVVDPLGCSDLRLLGDALDDELELIVHSGEQDLAILDRHLGRVPARVFDTQIAAAFLGYGHKIGYSRLVEICCGTRPKSSEAYTDWAKRPLEERQIDYALDDVRYLLRCRSFLVEELEAHGRFEWAEQECSLARATALEGYDPYRQWRKVSGVRGLNGQQLAILREVAAWREQEAAARNEPRQRIVSDRVLVELARRAPERREQLRSYRGMHPKEASRSAKSILAAVLRGKQMPPESRPARPRRSSPDDDPNISALATLLDAFLRARALELEISSRLLANRRDLERLVRLSLNGDLQPAREGADAVGPDDPPPLLHGWRRRVVGEDLLRLLRGELVLGVEQRQAGRPTVFVKES
jgi:ribonuclease D